GRISPWFKPQMVGSVLVSECESAVPQTSSVSRTKEKSEFGRSCVVSIHGWGGWNSTAKQRRGYRSRLQIIRSPCLDWHLCRPGLAHNARRRRIFRTACCARRRRTTGQKRETRYSGDQANGYYRVFTPHTRWRYSLGLSMLAKKRLPSI